MWRMLFGMARAIALTFVMAFCCYPQTLKIWPGVAPGSENWTQKESKVDNIPLGTVVFNVVTPTLTVYLPERTKATGTGIIIAPGGAFVALAIDLEGHDVARWLQNKGIAAFVLKYRIMEKYQEGIPEMNMARSWQIRHRRRNSGRQSSSAARRGMGHFSGQGRLYGFFGRRHGGQRSSAPAGCRRTSKLCCTNLWWTVWRNAGHSGKTAAHFLAWAQDDALAISAVIKFYDSLKSAGYKPEAHIFSAGGHGFGMRKQGTSSDHWIDEFYYWLEAQGFTQPAAT